MIEIINELPENVVGFRATGKVTKDDYEKFLMPAVDAQAKKFNKINFLLWVDTDVSNYTFGAWVDDALVGLQHLTHWHKVAIVSHYDAIKKITHVFAVSISESWNPLYLPGTRWPKKLVIFFIAS